MIFLMTGSPGSGKSLHMAKDLYWHVKMGRPVVANFDINRDMFKNGARSFFYVPEEDWTPARIEEISAEWFKDHQFKEGCLTLYWDEAQVRLNSRDWRNNSTWNTFFQQHRKYGYNVYLICQHHEMLDKQARSVVEYEVHHRKVNNVGLFGKIVSLVSLGHPVICAVTTWYGQKMRLGAEWLLGTRKYYRLYDTLKIFNRTI